MSTTGTYITDPKIAEYGDEAFERAGVQPAAIGAEHIASLRRSIGFLLSTWAVKGPRQWKFGTLAHVTTTLETSFDLPAGMIDVKTVTLTRSSNETEMLPMSRSEYRVLHNKTVTGRPVSYFVDRRRNTAVGTTPDVGAIRPKFFYWRAAENSTDIITVEYYSQIEDVAPTGMSTTLDIPFRFQEPFVAALAARMAQKWNYKRFADLDALAARAWKDADSEDTENAPLFISVDYGGRYGRR